MKRLFDLAASFAGLLFLLPLFVVVAMIIVLESSGGVFFVQKRAGRGGVPFTIYKFRTMRSADVDEQVSAVTADGDLRITRVGKILRKTRLDELPQLLNVCTGQMSLVGPRPEVSKFIDMSDPVRREILSVRPGITGLSQLIFRHEEEMFPEGCDPEEYYRNEILPEKNRSDLYYVRHQTFVGDLKIIVETLLGATEKMREGY